MEILHVKASLQVKIYS